MKKLKVYLLVIIASLLNGLFPHNVLAANYPPNTVSNITVKQIGKESVRISWGMPATDATHDDAVSYDLSINNGYSDLNIDENSIDINGNLDIGVSYTVTIKANNDKGSSSATKNFVLSPYLEDTLINGGLIDPTDQQTSKNIAGQNMHGHYKNNTNTCANCHSVHQAKSEEGLLTKTSAYESCISCHDGSLGFYNVFEKNMENDNGAGTYGGSYDNNMSLHMPTGDLKIENAPGAKLSKTEAGNIDPKFANGHWGKNFTCTSCHNPHGSSADRLLQTNPNGYSRIARQIVNGAYYGGLITDEIEVVNLVRNQSKTLYENINNTITSWAAPVEPDGVTDLVPKDSPSKNYRVLKFKFENNLKLADQRFNYEVLDESKDSWILQVYKYDKYLGKWIPIRYSSVGPFSGDGIDLGTGPIENRQDFNGQNFDSTKNGVWKKAYSSDNGASLTEGYMTVAWYGYIVIPNDAAADITFVKNIATLFDFKFDKKDENNETGISKSYTYKVDHAKTIADQNNAIDPNVAKKALSNLNQFNEWCASCHIGYNISSEQKKSIGAGVYTHHASSEDDQLPCVQCHYSHGTDATWMKDEKDYTYKNIVDDYYSESNPKSFDYVGIIGKLNDIQGPTITKAEAEKAAKEHLLDTNLSSALKRYTNTTSCYRCHGTSEPTK